MDSDYFGPRGFATMTLLISNQTYFRKTNVSAQDIITNSFYRWHCGVSVLENCGEESSLGAGVFRCKALCLLG